MFFIYHYLYFNYIYVVAKKKMKRKKNQFRQLEWRERTKKIKKKRSHHLSLSRADIYQEGGSFPSFETAGMKKTTKEFYIVPVTKNTYLYCHFSLSLTINCRTTLYHELLFVYPPTLITPAYHAI